MSCELWKVGRKLAESWPAANLLPSFPTGTKLAAPKRRPNLAVPIGNLAESWPAAGRLLWCKVWL